MGEQERVRRQWEVECDCDCDGKRWRGRRGKRVTGEGSDQIDRGRMVCDQRAGDTGASASERGA